MKKQLQDQFEDYIDEEGSPVYEDIDDEEGAPYEDGDPDEFDQLEEGDFEDDDEEGAPYVDEVVEDETEQGAPRRRRRRMRRRNLSKRSIGRLMRKKASGELRVGRNGRSVLRRAAKLNSLVRSTDISYIRVEGGKLVSASCNVRGRMTHPEVQTVLALAYTGRVIEPVVRSFAAGAPSQFVFDARNDAGLTGSNFFGGIITVEASALNMVPGGQFTLAVRSSTFNAGASDAVTMTFQMYAGRRVMTISLFFACLQGGQVRLVNTQSLPYNAVLADPPLDGIYCNGLPANYTAKIRLFNPADSDFGRLLHQM